jgi:hypothetical protein
MISRLLCLTIGHALIIKSDGSHVYGLCMRCGHQTPGWTYGESPAQEPNTQAYWDATYAEFLETELMLHGGG